MSTTILLVDDEKKITELARLYLENDGFQVIAVHDGEAALRTFQSEQPGLIVLDLMLPLLDGYEVCRRIRAQSDVPILMLTARDEDVDKIVGLELGADDYLTKPFNPRELVARVKAILRRPNPPPKPSALHSVRSPSTLTAANSTSPISPSPFAPKSLTSSPSWHSTRASSFPREKLLDSRGAMTLPARLAP